ncbi:MAG: uroporphyrinogen decarboxylase family protein [Candidatus Merdivicinus sp.]|jgi:hypothetical protein
MQQEIQARKQKWIDFADPASPVNRILVVNYSEGKPERPMLWWEKMKEREEWAYCCYQQQMEDVAVIPDNTIPFLSIATGTEIFAEAFGCKVHKPENNNPFALPKIFSWQEVRSIRKPRLEDTKLTLLFEMADRLREKAGKQALLKLPDVQTPMDIAALIWEKSDFYAAMYEMPEAVHELAEMVKELLFEFFDAWFGRYGSEFIAHYPDYYMPCGITISEDEVGAVSAAMYREFFEKELVEISNRYGAIGVHCCADSSHQWENFKRIPNLKILNLVREKEETLASLEVFRNVCGQYPSHLIREPGDLPDAENLHLAQYLTVSTKAEACRIAEYFREHGILPAE